MCLFITVTCCYQINPSFLPVKDNIFHKHPSYKLIAYKICGLFVNVTYLRQFMLENFLLHLCMFILESFAKKAVVISLDILECLFVSFDILEHLFVSFIVLFKDNYCFGHFSFQCKNSGHTTF